MRGFCSIVSPILLPHKSLLFFSCDVYSFHESLTVDRVAPSLRVSVLVHTHGHVPVPGVHIVMDRFVVEFLVTVASPVGGLVRASFFDS